MLKQDLIEQVTAQLPDNSKKDIAKAVDIIFETIDSALVDGRKIEIRGFGVFSTRTLNGKTIKNPKTGKIFNIPERRTTHFTMSKMVKEALIMAHSEFGEADEI